MTDPDVTPVGFAATDAPGARLRRRRNPLWLAIAGLLALVALGGAAWFVVEQLGQAGRDDAVAEGTVAALGGPPAAPVRLVHDGGDLTIWLDTRGILVSETRDVVVAATVCTARSEDGRTSRVRGSRQGASVTIGDRSTIGLLDEAPAGTVAVACEQQPFGRRRGYDRLRAERAFFVTPGDPGIGWLPWAGVLAAVPLLLLALVPLNRWRGGSVRRSGGGG